MKTFFSNRYADAFAKTILFCGTTHLIILIWKSIQGNPYALNVFNIVGLNLLNPGLEPGWLNFTLSSCASLAIYCLIYIYLTNRTNKDKP
jgi:hypothetical protein